MKDGNLGFAIVGCGVIGPWHANGIKNSEGAQLVAVCDIVEEKARKLADEFGCEWHTSLDELLARDDVDVVNICTPSGMHADMGIQAARAGKHVLIEKPIDISLERIDELITTCQEAGVKLGGIFQRRASDTFTKAKSLIDEGWLGNLILGDAYLKYWRSQAYYDSGEWRGTKALDGGGALMNQGVHCIDVLQWFMGPVKRIYGRALTLARKIEVEDTAAAVLEFANGAIGVIEGTTSVYPGLTHRIEIHGTRGTMLIEGEEIKRLEVEGEQKPDLGALAAAEEDRSAADPTAIGTEGHRRQIQDMVHAIGEDRDPMVTGEEARKAVEIVLAIYRSSQTGRPVRLPLREKRRRR